MAINTRYAESIGAQKDLQKRYLSNDERIPNLLGVFRQCLEQRELTTTIDRSKKGSTGFTFLCSFPSTAFPDEKERQPLNLVLKWQPEDLCEIEKMGSFIFKSLGFPAPNTFSGSKSDSIALFPFAAEKNPLMSPLAASLSMIVMPQLHASNFEGTVKNGILKRFSKSDLRKLGFQLGQIALIDMLMGNDDRLIKFQPGYEEQIPPSSSFNPGNVMIESHENSLQRVFPIDNCLASSLVEKKSSIADVENFQLFFFNDDSASSPTSLSPPLTISKQDDLDKKSEIYAKIFINLIRHLQDVALHIKENIRQEISRNDSQIDDYKAFIESLPESLYAGIMDSIQKIKKYNPSSLSVQETLDSNTKRMLKLTLRNIEFLKNVQE